MCPIANEINISGTLTVTNPAILQSAVSRTVTAASYNMAGRFVVESQMSLTTGAVAIPLGGVTQPHYAWFKNMTAMGSTVSITAAVSNGGPNLIRLTATAHGLNTGNIAFVIGVTGTTEANGLWTVTKIDANTVDLQGSTFTNTFVSGGTIQLANTCTIRNGSSGADVIQLMGGESAGPVPLLSSGTFYALCNVAPVLMDYFIVNT